MALSPTQRTLAALRQRGMRAQVVEKWNQFAGPHGIRQDLFGFVDVLALDPERPGSGFLGVQACGQGGSGAKHFRKITEECNEAVADWLAAGGRVELWQWRKVKVKRGGKAMRWSPRVTEIKETDVVGGRGE